MNVNKSAITDLAFALFSFRQINKLLDGSRRLAVGIEKEWAVNRVGTILDGLDIRLNTINQHSLD